MALFLYKPTLLARATYQFRFDGLAWLPAHRVMEQAVFPSAIRTIYFIHVAGTPPGLTVEAVAAATRTGRP